MSIPGEPFSPLGPGRPAGPGTPVILGPGRRCRERIEHSGSEALMSNSFVGGLPDRYQRLSTEITGRRAHSG